MKFAPISIALLVTASLASLAAPSQAASSAEAWLVTVDSTGQVATRLVTLPATDSYADCSGVAPTTSTCSLTGSSPTGNWNVGWYLPTAASPMPKALSVQSTKLVMRGSNTASTVVFECNWAYSDVKSVNGVSVSCKLISFAPVAGALSVDFTTGAYDLALVAPGLPSTHDQPGVGPWHAFLNAF